MRTYTARYDAAFARAGSSHVVGLFNDSTEYRIAVLALYHHANNGIGTANKLDPIRLTRITGHAGGRLATICPMDSSVSVPAGISVRVAGDCDCSTPITGNRTPGGTGEAIGYRPFQADYTEPGYIASHGPLVNTGPARTDLFNALNTGDQPIVLREGEGISITGTGNPTLMGRPMICNGTFVFNVVATGETYVCNWFGPGPNPMHVASLMNATGSGVVLEVYAIEYYPEPKRREVDQAAATECNNIPLLIDWVVGKQAPDIRDPGIVIPIVGMDPNFPCPAGITAVSGPFRLMSSTNIGPNSQGGSVAGTGGSKRFWCNEANGLTGLQNEYDGGGRGYIEAHCLFNYERSPRYLPPGYGLSIDSSTTSVDSTAWHQGHFELFFGVEPLQVPTVARGWRR